MVRPSITQSFEPHSLGNFMSVPAAPSRPPFSPQRSAGAVADAEARARREQQQKEVASRRALHRRGNEAGKIFERILAAADEKKFSLMYLFARYDKDGSGELDPQEFSQALRELRVLLRPSELEAVMAELDTDGDGSISISEFYSRMRQAQKDQFASAAPPDPAVAQAVRKAERRRAKIRSDPRRAATALGHTNGLPEYASRHRCVVSWDPHNQVS